MITSSTSLAVLDAAYTAMDEAIKFGKVAPSDVDAVKAAVALGIAPPKPSAGKPPFVRRELKGTVPDGAWPHHLAALEQCARDGLDRNELEASRKSATGKDLARIEGDLRFLHKCPNAIRNALWGAKSAMANKGRPATGGTHPELTNDRVRVLIEKATASNIAGDPSRQRRPLDPVEAKLSACRWVVGLILRAERELGEEKVEDLIGTARAHAVAAFQDAAHGLITPQVHKNAVAFMVDAVRFHRVKLAQYLKTAPEQKPAEKTAAVTYASVVEAVRAETQAMPTDPVQPTETPMVEAAPASKPAPRTRRIRKGHRVGLDGVVEPLYVEVPAH